MQRLLFLCTGNYYRSRYAEQRFNALAPAAGLRWQADSRGLDIAAGVFNVGPLSPHTIARLHRLGLAPDAPPRFPLQALEADFAQADLVVALKEREHRPMLAARFRPWVERVEYWHVDDVDQAHPDDALALIDAQLERLILRLARSP
ncbi:MAG: low molecular weight phosphatase family protein [Nevskia sp.]|nr:low molecular weight phosphatase family protein [Nevskia sp.]